MINGDFVKHGVALPQNNTSVGDPYEDAWNEIKNIITYNMDMVREYFPGKDILPTIGNNDVIVHDQMPCSMQQH